jgi:tRNA(fMet)-specific endonuclease VapC
MGSLIDTSIFIECERGRVDLDSNVGNLGDESFSMSVITASELLHGIHRAAPQYRPDRIATIENWIARFSILDIDLAVARQHSRLHASLQVTGLVIGPHDLWIAATCLTYGMKIVTANQREFDRVPGLEVDNWTRVQ